MHRTASSTTRANWEARNIPSALISPVSVDIAMNSLDLPLASKQPQENPFASAEDEKSRLSLRSSVPSIKSILSVPTQDPILRCDSAPTSQVADEHKDTAAVADNSLNTVPALELAQQQPCRSRTRSLCLQWLDAYRILLAATFSLNIALVIFVVNKRVTNQRLLIAVSTNLFVSVLIRQEDLLNLIFNLVAKLPISLPLWFRVLVADFHHYGGLHVGCTLSALIWYISFVTYNTIETIKSAHQGKSTGWIWASLATFYAFLLCVLVICIWALPMLRQRCHNTFELTHRFGGWLAILVLWINTGVATHAPDAHTPLYSSASFWLLAATTILIILPWTRIRRVTISTELVSSRELKITFPCARLAYTSTARFSHSPLLEWHAFATIPSDDLTSASILVSAAGDWTRSLIAHPPSTLWLRSPVSANFLTCVPLFTSILLVATGAGIGPMLSLLRSPAVRTMLAAHRQVRVMWTVRSPEAVHWQFVQDAIRSVDPTPKIFDTVAGRPDVAFEAGFMARQCGIEAVMVVSNPKTTYAVVEEVKMWGGAAYGATFDS